MAENYSVAISYNNALGYVELDEAAHKITVVLGDDEGKAKAEHFLSEKHQINVPGDSLLDFHTVDVDPAADIKSFQLAMTRLWEATLVHVDWSRPVEYVKAHPHY